MIVGFVLTALGLVGVVTATAYYILDTRLDSYDAMGAAMMFDDVMVPSLLVLSIGIVVVAGLRWWWAIVVFTALFFMIGIGYKFVLIHLLAHLRNR
jgi:hypothetical protein